MNSLAAVECLISLITFFLKPLQEKKHRKPCWEPYPASQEMSEVKDSDVGNLEKPMAKGQVWRDPP